MSNRLFDLARRCSAFVECDLPPAVAVSGLGSYLWIVTKRLIQSLKDVFGAVETRRFDNPDGTIMHAELRIDDSIIMLSDSTETYPANRLLLHVYVPDVDGVYQRALESGFVSVEEPRLRDGDPDRRGMVRDQSGNTWAIGTQL